MAHEHTHHHAPSAPYSLLRASVAERLVFAAAGTALLWLVAGWALGWV